MRAKSSPLGITVVTCCAGAVLAVAGGLALGSWRAGAALAIGLLVGAANGFLARRSLGADLGFGFTSLGRLALLSAAGVGLGALLGLAVVPLVLAGIAGAQLVLAAAAAVTMVRSA